MERIRVRVRREAERLRDAGTRLLDLTDSLDDLAEAAVWTSGVMAPSSSFTQMSTNTSN